jgi:hypothetical protein
MELLVKNLYPINSAPLNPKTEVTLSHKLNNHEIHILDADFTDPGPGLLSI